MLEQVPPVGQTPAVRDHARQALEVLDQALESFPKQIAQILQEAEIAVVRLRDGLIRRLREAQQAAQRSPLRAELDQTNICLSLVIGTEYPQGAIKREALETARDILRQIIERESKQDQPASNPRS